MKKSLYLIAGILIGITLFGGSSVLAAGITAERSTNRVYVDGQEVRLTAYNINGNNYVMLRDIGREVGFNVYWNDDARCVQVESDKPYTGIAPVKAGTSEPASQPEVTTPADDVADAKQDIVDRTNALRRAKGVAALRVNDKLMQAAQVRADEIAASGVYSHTRPDGRKSNTVTDSKSWRMRAQSGRFLRSRATARISRSSTTMGRESCRSAKPNLTSRSSPQAARARSRSKRLRQAH